MTVVGIVIVVSVFVDFAMSERRSLTAWHRYVQPLVSVLSFNLVQCQLCRSRTSCRRHHGFCGFCCGAVAFRLHSARCFLASMVTVLVIATDLLFRSFRLHLCFCFGRSFCVERMRRHLKRVVAAAAAPARQHQRGSASISN